METIVTYLDSMFAAFPSTDQVRRAYGDLLATMEDRYNELIGEGKSEQEAIGAVIMDFGNIDELMDELGIEKMIESDEVGVSAQEAAAYLEDKEWAARLIALGILLCALGPAIVMGVFLAADEFLVFGIVCLSLAIAGGVVCFILAYGRMEPYGHLQEVFVLSGSTERQIRGARQAFSPLKTRCLVGGIVALVLSPMAVMLLVFSGLEHGADLAPSAFLVLAAAGAAVLTYMGYVDNGFKVLLQEGEYSPQNKTHNKFIEAIAPAWWCLTTAVYLITSFVSGAWSTTWIIWLVSGVLFGALAATPIYGKRKKS